ncbi:MAG: SDR family oxidoreductase, partial [Bacteroidales bacterium]
MKAKSFLNLTLILLLVLPLQIVAQVSSNKENSMPQKRDVHRLDKDYFIPGRFNGKTILITGGARGIGKWTAIRAVKEGANVVIMDWLDNLGQQVADSINKACSAWGGEAVIKIGVEKFGKIDYACLNAGVMDGVFSGTQFKYDKSQIELMPATITNATDEYWDNVFKTNAAGTFKSLRSTLRQMLRQNN